jgi:RNA dependent RNA polymerase
VGDDLYSVKTVSNLYFQYAAAAATDEDDVSNDYIVVHMADDAGATEIPHESRGRAAVTRPKADFKSYNVDPLREMILRKGIVVQPHDHDHDEAPHCAVVQELLFKFLDCSNSQVQRHCYIFRRSTTLQENETRLLQMLPGPHELEKKKGIPKRVKYAGLLFSGITSVKLPSDGVIVEELESKVANKFDFTDGPGVISLKLALWVKEQLGIKGDRDDCPSIFQIRYCGRIKLWKNGEVKGYVCKGVLVVDPTNNETYTIQVRKSLMKIEASSAACDVLQDTLGICDYSRPTPGRLGQQQICLLSGTVAESDFLKLQNENVNCTKNSMQDPFCMAWVAALRPKDVWKRFHELILFELDKRPTKWDGHVPLLYRKCADLLGENDEGNTRPKKIH